jgi:CRP-like cAMP-binding protein
VAKGDVVNYHAPTTATARTVNVSLESDVPPAEAISILKAAAVETPGVQAAPEPFVFLEDYADAVVYQVKFWISEPKAHHRLEHDVRVHIWYRLREKGIILPNPVRTVEHISQARKARQQREAARGHRLAAIESVPLLGPLTAEEKLQLADSASEVFLTAGQVLFRQNDTGSSFYVIYKGSVEVLVSPDGAQAAEQHVVATLKAGDFFGEMSALTGQPRTATIRAAAPLACVEIEKGDLLAIFRRDPLIMGKISEIVARRNAEREAVLQNAGAAPEMEMVFKQQQTLLGRMMSFFGLGKAA